MILQPAFQCVNTYETLAPTSKRAHRDALALAERLLRQAARVVVQKLLAIESGCGGCVWQTLLVSGVDVLRSLRARSAAKQFADRHNSHTNKKNLNAKQIMRLGIYCSYALDACLGCLHSAALHNAEYDFNDDAIEPGIRWFTELVQRRLPTSV